MHTYLYFDDVLDCWIEFTPTEQEDSTRITTDWNRTSWGEEFEGTILIEGMLFNIQWHD